MLPRIIGLSITIISIASLVAIGTLWKPFSDLGGPRDWLSFYTNPIMLLFLAGIGIYFLANGKRIIQIRHGTLIATLMLGAYIAIMYSNDAASILGGSVVRLIEYAISSLAVLLTVTDPSTGRGRIRDFAEKLGDASYAVYLFHVLTIMALGQFLLKTGLLVHPLLYIVLAMIVANLVGLAINRIIERPLTRQINKYAGRKNDPVLAAVKI